MANYDTLKATIDAYIRQNGVKAITGPVLNGVLRAMVDSLGNGFLFAGEALPNGDPGTPDQNVVRYATQAGTYTNYGGYVHDGKHLVWFVWHGSWHAYPTQVPTDSSLPARVSQLANDAGYITADALAAFYTKVETDALLAGKQDELVSGDNIKTINGESILGSGDITIQGGGADPYFVRGTIDFNQDPPAVTITSGTYAEALAAYNDGSPVYAALTEGNGAVNIYPLAQVISPFIVFLGIGADSVLAVVLESDGTVTAVNSALVHPSDLAPVATSGDYNDLTNKPTIPAAQVQSDWNEADNTDPAYIKNKPSIPTVPDISTDIVTDRASDTKTASPKAVFDALAKYGVIRQTQTWSWSGSNPRTYVMSNLVMGLIPQAFIDLAQSAGATFNLVTGYFELNGLTDLSYEEMKAVFIYGGIPYHAEYLFYYNMLLRTNLPLKRISINLGTGWFARDSSLETICLNEGRAIAITNATYFIYASHYLRKVVGVIDVSSVNVMSAAPFNYCESLESIEIKGIKDNVSFNSSSNLTAESVAYMISNAGTATIIITLHATAYARATADTAVQAALAAKTNVTLASA